MQTAYADAAILCPCTLGHVLHALMCYRGYHLHQVWSWSPYGLGNWCPLYQILRICKQGLEKKAGPVPLQRPFMGIEAH